MDFRRADLHLHTTCSDGRLAPAALVRLARRHGLAVIAVTDHDTLAGVAEAMAAGHAEGVEVLPGVELSVTVDAREVHLLGYGFDPDDEALLARLAQFRAARRDRGAAIVRRLQALGLPLHLDDVAAHVQGAVLARPHVAAALVARGFATSYADAFERFLRDGGPAHVPKPALSAAEALRLLHEAGGVGVLAHPGMNFPAGAFEALLAAGLDGVETVHPSHSVFLVRYYRALARRHGLLETGGSDYHGTRPLDAEHLGRYCIPADQVAPLRRAA